MQIHLFTVESSWSCRLTSIIKMATGYLDSSSNPQDMEGPQPHPYLHEPLLYISNLPPYVTDENLAMTFQPCAPFRPNITRDGSNRPLSGTIEFKYLEKGLPDLGVC